MSDVEGLHDVMTERGYNVAGVARSYQDVTEVCRAVTRRELPGQDDAGD
ncbi:MAG: hypothetical protein M3Q48_15330 [Actinomycetota bacterium]|nr:hypothetical protein [Actinomycetota bacterium]